MLTNRDIYSHICAVVRRHDGNERTLEEYLRALWLIGRAARATDEEREALTVERFLAVHEAALTSPVAPYDRAWEALEYERGEGFDGWERKLFGQIVDLKELRAAGAYEDPQRGFGTNAPRGGRWYNFAPLQFLECAAAGAFGAHFDETAEPDPNLDDDDDAPVTPPEPLRIMVPGKVAVLGPEGKIVAVDPHEIEEPTYELTHVTWDEMRDFLCQGQYYE